MKISLFQYSPAWEDKISNENRIVELLKSKFTSSDLLIFPEMTLTGFTMQSSAFAEDLNGKSFNFFSNLSKELNTDIFCGIIEKSDSNYFNTLAHFENNGKLKKTYRKIHPFSFSDEDKFYSGGSKVEITEIKNINIGLSICYDLRFPELFRFYAKEKVPLIVNIANWPVTRINHYRHLLKARAIENQCFAIGVNRVGEDPKATYNGFSSFFDPTGEELISIENEETILYFEIDINQVEQVRKKFPFINDIKLI